MIDVGTNQILREPSPIPKKEVSVCVPTALVPTAVPEMLNKVIGTLYVTTNVCELNPLCTKSIISVLKLPAL